MHTALSEDDKIKICYALNYEKLSAEAYLHLSENTKFPSKSVAQALTSQQFKLKNLLHSTDDLKSCNISPHSFAKTQKNISMKKDEFDEQVVLYAGKLDISAENERMRAHLQGMQCRVMELEKVCRKMQAQMAKITKSRGSTHSNPRSLPKLCSWETFLHIPLSIYIHKYLYILLICTAFLYLLFHIDCFLFFSLSSFFLFKFFPFLWEKNLGSGVRIFFLKGFGDPVVIVQFTGKEWKLQCAFLPHLFICFIDGEL